MHVSVLYLFFLVCCFFPDPISLLLPVPCFPECCFSYFFLPCPNCIWFCANPAGHRPLKDSLMGRPEAWGRPIRMTMSLASACTVIVRWTVWEGTATLSVAPVLVWLGVCSYHFTLNKAHNFGIVLITSSLCISQLNHQGHSFKDDQCAMRKSFLQLKRSD